PWSHVAWVDQIACALEMTKNVRTAMLTRSLMKMSTSFGVYMFAVSGIARAIDVRTIETSMLYAREIVVPDPRAMAALPSSASQTSPSECGAARVECS